MTRYSRRRINSILEDVDSAPNADAKGAALEELGKYLFEKVPGVECAGQNILDAPRAHELDLAFWNDQRLSILYFLDAVLIVECKASDNPVGSAEVGWFVRKLQDRGAQHGILIALNGITGDGETSAHNEILTALIRDRVKILLFTRPEILTLSRVEDLSEALKDKLLQLTLKRTVHFDGG
jgi:hypothetical protein